MRVLIVLAISFLVSINSYATISLTSGKFSIKNVTSPELYVFCSQVSYPIVLERVDFDNPGVQAGWSSLMPPRLCSVFLTDKSPFVFACTQESSGEFKTVDCEKTLLAARLPWSGQTVSNQVNIQGSFWIAENISPDEISIMLRHRGLDL